MDGPEALRLADLHRPDLVVLDVMLPGFDGIELMRRLHERPGKRVAVILLTARGEESDRLVGLRHGADDYVVKPFSPAELVARVEAVMRRVSPPATDEDAAPPIEHGPLRVEPAPRRVFLEGEDLSLTQREFDRLSYLAARPGRVFSRDQLMEAVWEYPFFTDTSTRHRPHPPPLRQARRRLRRAALHRDGVGGRLQVQGMSREGASGLKRAAAIAVTSFLTGAAAVAVPHGMGAEQIVLALLAAAGATLAGALAARLAMEERANREIEEMRRQLLAAASHDLRTPLASLRLLVESIDDNGEGFRRRAASVSSTPSTAATPPAPTAAPVSASRSRKRSRGPWRQDLAGNS